MKRKKKRIATKTRAVKKAMSKQTAGVSRPTQKRPRLVLVDGSSYLYRAFHAMPNFTNSRGEHTGAIYGVTNMLRRLMSEYDPQYIAVVFDAKGKTFRDDIYPEYKANRPPMPDDLGAQVEPIFEVVRAMGLPLLQIEGVEADDVIGTLARQAAAKDIDTLISTGDKDMAQLVGPHIELVNTMTDTVFDRVTVENKFGVPPERIIDYLALVGDSVDNIPGVEGVGPKTAAKWLVTYGDLDTLIARASEIDGKVGERLRQGADRLPLSRQLATIKCDVSLPVSIGALALSPPDDESLRSLFSRFEFKTWLAELGGLNTASEGSDAADARVDYDLILTEDQLEGWLQRLEAAGLFAFDTETTALDPLQAQLVGVSFSDRAGQAAYVPLAHDAPDAPKQLDRDYVLARLKPLLDGSTKKIVGHNLKYDMSVLAKYGIELSAIKFDSMLESYVFDSTASRHDMDSLALKYLGYKTLKYEDVTGKGKSQINFSEVPVERAAEYAAEDADITLRLHTHLWPRVRETASLVSLYEDIELPLLAVLSRMERNGVKIDVAMLRKQSNELSRRMLELESESHSLAGQAFNLDSPKQIQEILFGKLKLPIIKKTPKGQPSTAEDVLQELALDYPLPQLILNYRSLSKLKSTYTDKLPEMINPKTGRVHTSYHQAVAATGRLSSSDPNLQNIPVRTEEGRRIRQAFIAEPGFHIVSADYSQIELRIMAHLSGDEGLITAFQKKQDVHRATAAEVFGVDTGTVTDEMRRHAKAINFGLIYGMSAFGLARQLRIERAAAQQYVDQYFTRYPKVREFMDATRAKAHERGYVETLFGRRLYLTEINATNQMRRQAAERAAINAPMQGTAADLIKRAMLAMDRWIKESGLPVRMIMQVHDELVFEVAEHDLRTAQSAIRRHMIEVATLTVPLEVDLGAGANWDEAH